MPIETPTTDFAAPIRTTRSNERRDTATFEEEALPWLDDVYRFALSLTRDEADADDVVQDTYLRAFKSWHTYLPGSDCRRWLFTICRNVFLRSRERQRPTLDMEEAEREVLATGARFRDASHDSHAHMLSTVDLGPALQQALALVPEPFQTTILLVDVEDQSYEAAAELLGVPIGTIRSRLFRARRIMQELLAPHARDAGFSAA
jgi:RNA polymerase sigma-70 factor, ECF subfamily